MNRCVKRNIDQRCERDREIARSKNKRTNVLQLRQGKCFFMLDVTMVGSELAPAQQDSTLADLLFFLDQFGSTRAVRIKLHEQQSEIRRLERQVERLMHNEDESTLQKTTSTTGEIGDPETQIVSLRSTLRWFEDGR
ncbi:hypothetical protein F441_12198 [Phytophthora nicotianae CJ01A1]|uniref:Uncharacterized protein n=2 Tax=Phytophthora nicotianae TaxID=4792 RepID=W2N3V1_PHYNI|nr:hypothetical protein L915_11941 [Phytophthora nicotianae]ETM42573.1 hypothetical protein L914_11773 [Phytophthora nicotianae]ETP12398.1 hypothetical protein F441_12198 [Phytophthora nicotianae CJ01A1]